MNKPIVVNSLIYKKCFLCLGLIGLLSACNPKDKETTGWQQSNGEVFGTSYHITYQSIVDLQADFMAEFKRINKSLSTYDSLSLISRLNSGESLLLDMYFITVFEASKKISTATQGAFDPTIGDVVNAWGFGSKEKAEKIDSILIDSLMQYVGMEKLSIIDNRLIKKYPQTYLEFNALAKGYGLDRIAILLDEKHIENYVIEIGGEVRARGLNNKGTPFNIGIDKPVKESNHDQRSLQNIVQLSNKSLAASGNYRKYYTDPKTGSEYVHTINPKTGYPQKSNLLSSIVIADDCMTADAYATAFMVMGLEQTKKFLTNHPELEAMLIYAETLSEENFKVWTTPKFPLKSH